MNPYPNPAESPDPSYTDVLSPSPDNRLLSSSAPFFSFLLSWKSKVLHGSQDNFRTLLIDAFEKFAKDLEGSYPLRTLLALRYCLCAALDEAIMSTQDQGENWADNTLLNIFYKETLGGERFYIILDTLLENPENNADILEVLSLLLTLGFKGKNFNRDPLVIASTQQDVFRKIVPYLSFVPLPLDAPSLPPQRATPKKKFFWIFILLSLVLVSLFNLALDRKLDQATQPTFTLLEDIFNTPEENQ